MSHLHCRHSKLPKGICIDVSISNHERRSLQYDGKLPGTEMLLSCEALSTENQQGTSGRMHRVENVIRNESSGDKNKSVTRANDANIDSDIRDITGDVETSSRISLEQSDNRSTFQTDNNVKSFADLSPSHKRKSHKPSHIVTDAGHSDFDSAADPDWVEIVAATQPLTEQCPHCTFSCNTELQLKV